MFSGLVQHHPTAQALVPSGKPPELPVLAEQQATPSLKELQPEPPTWEQLPLVQLSVAPLEPTQLGSTGAVVPEWLEPPEQPHTSNVKRMLFTTIRASARVAAHRPTLPPAYKIPSARPGLRRRA